MLRKKTYDDYGTGEKLTYFYEDEPFVVDGIVYTPPYRYRYSNPDRPDPSMVMLKSKSQGMSYSGARVHEVTLEPDSELTN